PIWRRVPALWGLHADRNGFPYTPWNHGNLWSATVPVAGPHHPVVLPLQYRNNRSRDCGQRFSRVVYGKQYFPLFIVHRKMRCGNPLIFPGSSSPVHHSHAPAHGTASCTPTASTASFSKTVC